MFQPLGGMVTFIPDPKESKTKGGLHLPETFAEVMLTATVRNVGLGNKMENGDRDRPPLAPGDRVMIAQQRDPRTGKVVPYPAFDDCGTRVAICNAADIWGVIESAAKN